MHSMKSGETGSKCQTRNTSYGCHRSFLSVCTFRIDHLYDSKAARTLIRVSIDEDEPGETSDLVERLMGKKPELRFQYIQENARFVEELDV